MAFALTLDFFSGSHCETTDITESETELSSTGEREVLTGREQDNTTDTDDATEPITDRYGDSTVDG